MAPPAFFIARKEAAKGFVEDASMADERNACGANKEGDVFLKEVFSWRRFSVLVVAIGASAFGCVGLWVHSTIYRIDLIAEMRESPLHAIGGILFSVVFLLLVALPSFYLGILYLWRFATGRKHVVLIDTGGVDAGDYQFRWNDISWIGSTRLPLAKRVFLIVKPASPDRCPVAIRMDRNLLLEEYDSLMERLESKLGRKYSHLLFGVVRSWNAKLEY